MSDQRITLTRRYSTSRRRVFEAWTRPPLLRRWVFGGARKATKSVRVDLFPGGHLELVLRDGLDGNRRWGRFREVHAPDHLTFTLTSDGPRLRGQVTYVTVDIDGTDQESTLTLIHDGLPDDTADLNRERWEELLESLAGVLQEA
jgi:uncharacterized protein YndB with AHSA1/START domain